MNNHQIIPTSADPNQFPMNPMPNAYYRNSYGGIPNDADVVEKFNPLKLLWLVVHYRWLVLTCLVAGTLAGIFFTWQQTPLFRSSTKIEIATSGARVIKDLEVVAQDIDIRTIETVREKILSRDLARRVVYSQNLAENQSFMAPAASFSIKNLISRVLGRNNLEQFQQMTPEQRETRAVGIVGDNLSANVIRNTSIIEISFVHADPEYAKIVANQVARSFIDQGVDSTSETSDTARQFIQEQVIQTKKKLEESEKALVNYAKEAGITLTGEDPSLITLNLKEINTSLSKTIDERLLAERYVAQVETSGAGSLPQVFESKPLQELSTKITDLKASYQEKLATLKPGFPEMRRLQAQINELTNQRGSQITAIGRGVKIQLDQTVAKEAALRDELRKLEGMQAAFQEKNIDYTILKREVDSSRTQYDGLIAKLNEVGVGSELKTTQANVIDLAIAPPEPYTPRLGINLAVALILFSAIAGALIYILELMNNAFDVPDQIESELGLSVLGIIPKTTENEFASAFEEATSSLSEAYRTLRTSIQFTGTENSVKTLLVTSSIPSEGKTTTSYKLALDFATIGKRVLLIDADMRKPRMHRMFDTDLGLGLSNLLTNVIRSGSINEIFRKTHHPNLTFLSAGTIPPNPADLLISEKMGLTLHFCAKKFDIIIVDSPPVMGLSDAPILCRLVDSVLLVVSSKQVARKAAKQALARLRAANAIVVGAAMTKFSISKVDYNYAYRYMDNNYYTYGTEPGKLENHAATTKDSSEESAGIGSALSSMWARFSRNSA